MADWKPIVIEWLCKNAACLTLLGTLRDGSLFLEWGRGRNRSQYIVEGDEFNLVAVCPKCSTLNTTDALLQEASKIDDDAAADARAGARPEIASG